MTEEVLGRVHLVLRASLCTSCPMTTVAPGTPPELGPCRGTQGCAPPSLCGGPSSQWPDLAPASASQQAPRCPPLTIIQDLLLSPPIPPSSLIPGPSLPQFLLPLCKVIPALILPALSMSLLEFCFPRLAGVFVFYKFAQFLFTHLISCFQNIFSCHLSCSPCLHADLCFKKNFFIALVVRLPWEGKLA